MGQAKIKRERIEISATSESYFTSLLNESDLSQTIAQKAAVQAIKEIHNRSFSGRNAELGKMIKCTACGRRHRESEIHKAKYIAVAGETPETESLIEERRIRLVVGAAAFKGKRKKPPLNKRANEYVQVVRSLLPDEYTHEEMEKARKKAKRILANKYGRYGFLPPKWQNRKEANAKVITQTETADSTEAIQPDTAEVPVS